MKISDDYISTPDAIEKLFNIKLSEYKQFKDLIYSFVRHRSQKKQSFLEVKKESQASPSASNKSDLLIHRSSLIKLYNAVILQAFFLETKKVKLIFSSTEKRTQAADLIECILRNRQTILATKLQSNKVSQLIDLLRSENSLETNELPNPFEELPQLSLSQMTSLLQSLVAQSAVLSHDGSNMLLHFFNDDLEEAYQASLNVNSQLPIIKKYQSFIQNRYREAKEFDDTLDGLLN
ncbi:hypothetical protein [Celerinatantimonas diazotrophica]|uniref:Uncharacterized protein n=1 Tax=Celerinatantimonas diazotrophica TaxID=412034 RepID=A0A4R1K4R8_9GAMM|nr:hypothetical protein [Celerinatantimonas diazotrophica]TCK58927.1 hypothetical protein EV690_1085 [Celerinatantimonas diazotrophica]CAG9297560.1 hypothetical protein CEDIAZO_02748 [Celerinatantimonas diazotrophica]